MKKFKFNLETLLTVRKEKENFAHKEYISAKMVLDEQMEKIGKLQKEERNLEVEIREKQMGRSDAREINDIADYLHLMRKRIQEEQDEAMKLQNILETKRKAMTKAIQERKVLDKLKEKKYSEWEKEIKDLEKNFVDELATLRFVREKGSEIES